VHVNLSGLNPGTLKGVIDRVRLSYVAFSFAIDRLRRLPIADFIAQVEVVAHGVRDVSGDRDVEGTLHLQAGVATGELRLGELDPVPVRLHSAFTNLDVGVLRGLWSSEPALRVLAAGDKLAIGFRSRQDRDAAFAALFAGAQPRRTRSSAA
jgi:hypothetical protein